MNINKYFHRIPLWKSPIKLPVELPVGATRGATRGAITKPASQALLSGGSESNIHG